MLSWFRRKIRRPSAHEQRLLERCRGDHALYERLIAAELQRSPGNSRAQAADSAMARWDRDR
jgi:hypothetical protein